MVDPKTPERPRHPTSVPNPPLYYLDDAKMPPYSYHAGATPRSFKVSGTQQFTTPQAEKDRNQRYKTVARETRGHFVGPVNPAWFISRHLNIQEKIDGSTHSYPPFPRIAPKWTQLRKSTRESEMYESIVKGARLFLNPNPIEKGGFVDTHSAKDPVRDDLSPDIMNYSHWITAPRSKVDLSKGEYFIEAKTGKSFDPFVDNDDETSDRDPDYPFEAIANLRMITRGQILTYCAAIARSQFRTHVFGVIILGRHARLFRWDPSAMVVTSLFDYTKKKENYLAKFIWYYDHASLRTRGHDTSVERICEKRAIELVGEEIVAKMKEKNPLHSHFSTMNISDRDKGENQHVHLISYPPPYQRMSPFGRMTRTLQAFDVVTKEFVFVKDYWRVVAPGMEKESDIYRRLEERDVPNIAPFGNGNDVLCQVWSKKTGRRVLKLAKTRHESSPADKDKIQVHKALEKWQLFRMSLKVIGNGLETFGSTKQLVTAIADAMEAHDAAFFDAQILHRDISVGNILIHCGRGLLIDWDLCLLLDGKAEGPRRAQRTGTWQFMSAAILQDPKKVHEISDDRESAFHVLTWTALCYGHHDQTHPDRLREYLAPYDYSYSAGKFVKGGELKRDALMQSVLSDKVTFNPPLNRLIADLTAHLRTRYVQIKPRDRVYLESLATKIINLEQVAERTESQNEVLEVYRESRANNPVYQVSLSLQQLEMRYWFVKTMQNHLTAPDWPPDDKARQQGLHLTCNSKKRLHDEEDSPTEGLSRPKVERSAADLDVSSSRFKDSSGLDAVMEVEDEDED